MALNIFIALTACESKTDMHLSETSSSHIEQTKDTTSNDTEVESSKSEVDMLSIIQNKAAEIGGKLLKYDIADKGGDKALAVILHNDVVYDYWYFTAKSEKLVLSTTLHMSNCVKHEEGGVTSLIVYQFVIGRGFPANIVTLVNGEPVISSTYTGDGELPPLYYSESGDIVCVRGNGVSIGASNVIPYYWDIKTNTFKAYALNEISINDLKSMDTDNVVTDINKAISVYKRDNGLIHVNYADINEADINSTTIASRTYVISNNKLREYNSETDEHYGFFVELLSVSE